MLAEELKNKPSRLSFKMKVSVGESTTISLSVKNSIAVNRKQCKVSASKNDSKSVNTKEFTDTDKQTYLFKLLVFKNHRRLRVQVKRPPFMH